MRRLRATRLQTASLFLSAHLGSGEPLQAPFHALGIDYRYEIYHSSDYELCLRAETTQLFIDANGELLPYAPDYYVEWKKRFAVACPK